MKLLETSGQFSKPWEGQRLWAKSHDRTSSVKAQLSQPLEPGCGSFSIRMEPPCLCFVVSLATNPKSRNRCINWQSLGHVPLPTFKRSWEIKDPEFHLCTMGDFAQIGRSSGAGKRKNCKCLLLGCSRLVPMWVHQCANVCLQWRGSTGPVEISGMNITFRKQGMLDYFLLILCTIHALPWPALHHRAWTPANHRFQAPSVGPANRKN